MENLEVSGVKDFNGENTSDVTSDVVNPEILNIAQSKGFEGVGSFTDFVTDKFSDIVDSVKDFFGIGENVKEESGEYAEMASNLLSDIFTADVIKEWPSMEFNERCDLLNEYTNKLGETLQINLKGIVVEDLYSEVGEGTMGYNSGDGYLHLDYRNIEDPTMLTEILNTTTHEARHQLQNDAIDNPERFPDIPTSMVDEWKKNMAPGNYEDGEFDFEAYWNQPVEVDARTFAAEVIDGYINKIGLN